jgi:hypothetical protein
MNNATNATAPARSASVIAWGLAPIAWLVVFFVWLGIDPIDRGAAAPFLDALIWVLLILPAPWLLWASWRMPRPRFDTYLAEGGALAIMLVSLYVVVLKYLLSPEPGPGPVPLTVAFLIAAAVFVAAAVPLPGRRIAYGFAALACVILGIGFRMGDEGSLFHLHIGSMTQDEVFATVFLGIPALGAVLEVGRWWIGRTKTR